MGTEFNTGRFRSTVVWPPRYLWLGAPVILALLLFVVFYIRFQRDNERIANDPHVQAEIMETWIMTDAKSGRPTGIAGRIKYKRNTKNKTFDCAVSSPLGSLDANLKVGEILEIVPRLDSCYEPIILGRQK